MAGISRTLVTLKPGKMEEFLEMGRGVVDRVSEVPGLIGFGWAQLGDDKVGIFGIYDNTESAEGAMAVVGDVFADMAPFLAEPPERNVFEGEYFPAK